MPATRPTRRIVATLEHGRWIVWRGWWRLPATPGRPIQVQLGTSGYGTSDDEMLRHSTRWRHGGRITSARCCRTSEPRASEMIDEPDAGRSGLPKVAEKVGFTIHEVLRYGYGGLLALLVAAIWDPAAVKEIVGALGAALVALIAFASGAAIFTATRNTLLLVVFWAAEHIYDCLLSSQPRDWKVPGIGWPLSWRPPTVKTKYVFLRDEFGLRLMESEDAFRVIREEGLWSDRIQKRLYLQHSEIHSLYVTSFVFLVGGLLVEHSSFLIVVGILAAVTAGFADILVSRQEFSLLHRHKHDLRPILVRAGVLTPAAGDSPVRGDTSRTP
jgi:hypothetical protein